MQYDLLNFLENKTGIRRYIGPKRLILLVIFASIIFFLSFARSKGWMSVEDIFDFINIHPVAAPVIFVIVYALAMMFFVPTLPLNLGTGFLYGPFTGSLLAAGGGLLCAVGAFAVARSAFGQPLANKRNNKILKWLENELSQKGWQVVAFVRVNPIFPSGPLNFAFGLTSIKFSTYFWATILFQYPPTLAFSMLGHSAGGFVLGTETQSHVQTAMIACLALTLLFVFRIIAKIMSNK